MSNGETSSADFERRSRRIERNTILIRHISDVLESAIRCIERSADIIERNQLFLTLYALDMEIANLTVEIDSFDDPFNLKVSLLRYRQTVLMKEADQLRRSIPL